MAHLKKFASTRALAKKNLSQKLHPTSKPISKQFPTIYLRHATKALGALPRYAHGSSKSSSLNKIKLNLEFYLIQLTLCALLVRDFFFHQNETQKKSTKIIVNLQAAPGTIAEKFQTHTGKGGVTPKLPREMQSALAFSSGELKCTHILAARSG